jgi:ATP-dependent DNA helicase 2 subunit 2
MPFADDVRKYTFASLENLVSKNGESVTKHPYLPTEDQLEAMDKFIDSMDIMDSGEKDDEGCVFEPPEACFNFLNQLLNRKPVPWYDTRQSYNPAIHRTKQALFHSAVVNDITSNPLPPPHPELLKYINPPRWALKASKDAIRECKEVFKVKEGTRSTTFHS